MVRRIAFLILALTLNLSQAVAYGDSYSSRDSYGDSYCQAWNNYKYQNQFQTASYKQQSWWQNTINWAGSLFYKPPAAPIADQRRETRDQRPLATEHSLQTIEHSFQTGGQRLETRDQPAGKFTLPSKLSDCPDQISRKLFLENSPDYALVKTYQQSNGDGSLCDVYEYQSKTAPTPWGETVYIQPEQAEKLAQSRVQLNAVDQPASNTRSVQPQPLALPEVTPITIVQSASKDPIRQEPADSAKSFIDQLGHAAVQDWEKQDTAVEGYSKGVLESFFAEKGFN